MREHAEDSPVLLYLERVVGAESASPQETATQQDKHNNDHHHKHHKHVPVTPQPLHLSLVACVCVCWGEGLLRRKGGKWGERKVQQKHNKDLRLGDLCVCLHVSILGIYTVLTEVDSQCRRNKFQIHYSHYSVFPQKGVGGTALAYRSKRGGGGGGG